MKRVIGSVLLAISHLAVWAAPPSVPSKRVETDMGLGCRIAMVLPISQDSRLRNGGDPAYGRGGFGVEPLPKAWKSNRSELSFGLYCRPSDDPVMTGGLTRFDQTTGRWEKDLDARFGPMSAEDRKVLDKATQVWNIQAANSTGYAAIEEDTTGDEELRQRILYFCLFRLSKAICGGGDVGMLREGRKGDLTPHALKIIRSVEFLPDEPLTQLPDATDTTPSTETPASEAKP